MKESDLRQIVSDYPLLFWPESECHWVSNHGVDSLRLPNTTAVKEVHFAHYGILDDQGRVIQFGAIVGGGVFADVSVDYDKNSADGMNSYFDEDGAHAWAPGHEEGNGLHTSVPLKKFIKDEIQRSVSWSSVRLRDFEAALLIQQRRADLKAREERFEKIKLVLLLFFASLIIYFMFVAE